MSILISFIINIAIINLHYLGCVNSLNIVANKDISDEKTAMYMKTYIEDFKCSPDIGVKSTKLTSTWIDLLYLSYVVDKPKTFDYILSKKPTITRELIGEIISDYIIYLAKNGISVSKKTPNTLKSFTSRLSFFISSFFLLVLKKSIIYSYFQANFLILCHHLCILVSQANI